MLDMEPIKRRLADATPGPWHHGGAGAINTIKGEAVFQIAGARSGANHWMPDALLITHAPTDLAALVAEVERLRGEPARDHLAEHLAECAECREAAAQALK